MDELAAPIPGEAPTSSSAPIDRICHSCLGTWAGVEQRLQRLQGQIRSGLMMAVGYLLARADQHIAEQDRPS